MEEMGISKCKFNIGGACFSPDSNRVSCRSNANCDFLKGNTLEQQLKRKTEECEELKNCDKTLIYKQARNNFEKLNKYKQALQEIKKIIEKLPSKNSSIDWEAKAYQNIEAIKEISQIISEVEE